MTESTDDKLPREAYETERLRYQWYTSYSRENEYDKDPDWALDISSEEIEEGGGEYTSPRVKFFDDFDPEHIWIKSDTTRDLTDML